MLLSIKNRSLYFLAIICLIIGVVNFSYAKTNILKSDEDEQLLKEVIKLVKDRYVQEKSEKEIVEAALSGILSSLDPHSAYLNVDSFKEVQVQTKGQFGGVGIEIIMDRSLVKVISPIDDTPAYNAGIKAGDYISQINGTSVVGLTIFQVVDKLRGKPNTSVLVKVLREGEEEPLDFKITRKIIKINPVKSKIYNNIAYIKINSFSENADQEVIKHLSKLQHKIGAQKMIGLVLDLRNNPGGLLDQSVEISDLFLNKNQKIVSIKGKNKAADKHYFAKSDENLVKDLPIIVLINEGSASASEIVAGALQDHKRAVIMGQKSFGKGSVQSIIPMQNSNSAIKLTVALYYTPNDISIQADGIHPDVVVRDAKIEHKEKSSSKRTEASLNNHLERQITEVNQKNADKNLQDANFELNNQDYQLARALDLIIGLSVLKQTVSK